MSSAHAVQIKLESGRILEKAFAEYPVRTDRYDTMLMHTYYYSLTPLGEE